MAEVYYKVLQLEILMRPIIFNDLMVTFIDFINVRHDDDWVSSYHRHPWFEFNYVSEGSLYVNMENHEFLVESGCFYLIPPGVMHGHRHHQFNGDSGFCTRFRLEKLPVSEEIEIQRIADSIIEGLSAYQARPFCHTADQLLADIENAPLEVMEAAFIHWLMGIYRAMYPRVLQSTEDWKSNQKSNVIKQVLFYLEEGYASEIDVNQLADAVGYSYRHLARLFKEMTGTTIIEKLNSIRIAKAIHLLNHTDLSVRSICDEVGFNTETYFSTIFSEYTHLSPSSFRKEHRRKAKPDPDSEATNIGGEAQ